LSRVGALFGTRWLAGLCDDVRILVRILAQIKAGIVYHVALLHDVGAHGHVTSRSILADGLQADVVVWVGGSGKTLKHALLGQEQGTDVDGENGAFFDGILLVELDVLGEQMEGLGLVLEHLEDAVAARDNDDIKIVELGIGIVVVHVGLDGEALDRRHGGGGADELAVEGLAGLVLGVLERPAEDLERAGYVERVVGWEEGE